MARDRPPRFSVLITTFSIVYGVLRRSGTSVAIKMKLDAASHLVRQPISFELFLLIYLVCALALQMVNIYKTVGLAGLFVWCALIRTPMNMISLL